MQKKYNELLNFLRFIDAVNFGASNFGALNLSTDTQF